MNQVAATILQQLGGNKFVAMTGAKNFVQGEDMLQFALPANFAKGGINKVQIKLASSDLYTLAFYKWNARKLECKLVVPLINGVYADQLQEIFAAETGLALAI